MKRTKTNSIIVSAASLLAAVVMFVCDNPKDFNNPLDKDGSNYLFGATDDEAGKLEVGPNGEANLFDTSKYELCDGVRPDINLTKNYGPSVTINTLESDIFKKLVIIGGNVPDSVITYGPGKGGTAMPIPQQPAVLIKDGDDTPMNVNLITTTPAPGGYTIKYEVKKPRCNKTEPSATVTRSLIVEQYVAPDTGTPVIVLSGQENAQIKVGDNYRDEGVRVTVGNTTSLTYLDSIVVRGPNNARLSAVTRPIDDFTGVKLPNDLVAGAKYTITYYASYNGRTANKARTVEVTANTSSKSAVIVLNGYNYKLKNGTSFTYPDTMLYYGDRDNNYVEKGVERVYRINGDNEEPLNVSITPEPQQNFITGVQSGSGGVGRKVTYKVPAGSGYNAGEASRNVFLVEKGCEDPPTPPTITFVGDETLKISAGRGLEGKGWDYAGSWSVRNNEDTDFLGPTGYKYLIHFNGLNPYNPQPKTGGYKITYVGLGKCGTTAEKERTVIVE